MQLIIASNIFKYVNQISKSVKQTSIDPISNRMIISVGIEILSTSNRPTRKSIYNWNNVAFIQILCDMLLLIQP